MPSKRISKRRPLEKLLTPVLIALAAAVGWRVVWHKHAPTESDKKSASALCELANDLLERGQASKAEAKYRAALARDPECLTAHDRLAYLLGAEGRRFESLEHLDAVLRQRRYSLELLILAGEHSVNIQLPDELARFRAAAPDDPVPLVGLARIEMDKKQYTKAIGLLRDAIAADRTLIEAHALLGRILLEQPGDGELLAWDAALCESAVAHPDVWAVRGGWARRRGESRAAARCFWEALRRDANHHLATLQLSQLFAELGEGTTAADLAQRAQALADFSSALEFLNRAPDDVDHMLRAARQAEALGRLWEAWGWNQLVLRAAPNTQWPRSALARIEPHLNASLPPTHREVDPAVKLNLSHYPLPEFTAKASSLPPGGVRARELSQDSWASVTFEEVAEQVGIEFTYFCGREPGEPRGRMFHAFGGGIAVLDFDGDAWPDLYFTQGCRWPPQPGQTEHLDALYRNLGTGRFENVAQACHLSDERFGNGATVGDFNDDGFSDVYVADMGANRLYVNNGDGTFDDVSQAAGIQAGDWTTSCLLADLNGDGLPDIYDVNYVKAPDVFDRICDHYGVPATCRPGVFDPAPDRFYLNLGDGRFEEALESAGLRASGGNGMGIVAADFEGTQRLNVFVANDQNANFYFVNRQRPSEVRPHFEEHGLLAGLAYDGEGRTLACMGVAGGDADGDGKLDLLVTNFQEESSTFYLQESDGYFTDATGRAGLRVPSFAMLGFGTQFLDGELDGLPDLVVANGHIHEWSAPDVSGAMRPQYFRNVGGGRFHEATPDSLGPYFQGRYFGRSLVRLDFNRDGREDFAVSSLDSPAALIANGTADAGHFLAVQLRGVRSSRDAIGAIVTIHIAGRAQTQWLAAGDGYQASNQRQLVFGLGKHQVIDKLTISWPSGIRQEHTGLPADRELIFVEGRLEATFLLPRTIQP